MLNRDELKNVLRYEPETGKLYWLRRFSNGIPKSLEAGTIRKNDGYINVSVFGKLYPAHRVAYALYNGTCPDDMEIDHINHVRSDNRIDNLRLVSKSENRKNQSISSKSTTGVTGVYYNRARRKFVAQIKINGDVKYLGIFDSLEEAKSKRKEAEEEYGFHSNHGLNKAEYVRKKANARIPK